MTSLSDLIPMYLPGPGLLPKWLLLVCYILHLHSERGRVSRCQKTNCWGIYLGIHHGVWKLYTELFDLGVHQAGVLPWRAQ